MAVGKVIKIWGVGWVWRERDQGKDGKKESCTCFFKMRCHRWVLSNFVIATCHLSCLVCQPFKAVKNTHTCFAVY